MKQQALSMAIFGISTLIGVIAFLYPFWLPAVQQSAGWDWLIPMTRP